MNNYESKVIPTSYMYENIIDYSKIINTYCDCETETIRINCTRFSLSEYKNHIEIIRNTFKKYGRKIEIMTDIPFPGTKTRMEYIGDKEFFTFEKNQRYSIVKSLDDLKFNKNICFDNDLFFERLKIDDRILLGDNDIMLSIIDVSPNEVIAASLNTGTVMYRKAAYSSGSFFVHENMDKFKEYYVDFLKNIQPESIVFSFIERDEDLINIKHCLESNNIFSKIISKIETPFAVKNIERIADHSDGVLIGRGDLGITSKQALFMSNVIKSINYCMKKNMRTIVATDLLESLTINFNQLNRAELSDIYFLKLLGVNEFVASSNISRNSNSFRKFNSIVKTTKVI